MKKEDKKVVIETLTEQVNSYKHLYVSDISGLDAVDTQALRRSFALANFLQWNSRSVIAFSPNEISEISISNFATASKSSSAMIKSLSCFCR